MNESKQTNSLSSRILATKDILWRDLKFIQQSDFKELPDVERQKLKNSLLGNEFADPFKVWQDTDGVIYCLDGKHRTLLLEELISDGVAVPELLPAVFIDCKDKKEAVRMVLIYSSSYAQVTQQGFENFLTIHDLQFPELSEMISIPSLKFEELMPLPEDLDGEPKAKPATMKITFVDEKELEAAIPLVDKILKEKFPKAFTSVSAGEI